MISAGNGMEWENGACFFKLLRHAAVADGARGSKRGNTYIVLMTCQRGRQTIIAHDEALHYGCVRGCGWSQAKWRDPELKGMVGKRWRREVATTVYGWIQVVCAGVFGMRSRTKQKRWKCLRGKCEGVMKCIAVPIRK